MKFVKQKMLDRIEREGRSDLINDETIEIMDDLDGQEAVQHCWRRAVMLEPVFWVVGKSGTGHYVNENDCE